MKFNKSNLVIFLVLLLILLGLGYMWPFSKQPKIVETKTFSCPGMGGFTFEYPVFEGHEPGEPRLRLPPDFTTNGIGIPDRCRIDLGILGNLGMTNSIEVSVYHSDTSGKDLLPGTVIEKNPQNIPYLQIEDGYNFFTDYGAGNTVGITVTGIFNKSFSQDIFFQTVINSFQLTNLDSLLNKQWRFAGTAADTKGGAVLIEWQRGEPIYIEGLDFWPKDILGKEAGADGILRKKKFIPDPVGKDGQVAQGAEGEQYVLENAKWWGIESLNPGE